MTKVLVVMPYAVEEYARACLDTCRFVEGGHRMIVVDNAIHNNGIMRSHNYALDQLRDEDWFVILSAALRFGAPGGLDFVDLLTERSDHGVVSARDTYGWHLVGFRRDVVDAMGRWDENWSPYGYDDIDLSIRIHKLLPHVRWGAYPIDVTDMGMAHSINVGGVRPQPAAKLLRYFHSKWGVAPGSEFDDYNNHPFGLASAHLNWWPPARTTGAWNMPIGWLHGAVEL